MSDVDDSRLSPPARPLWPGVPGWAYGLVAFSIPAHWLCRLILRAQYRSESSSFALGSWLMGGIFDNLPWLLALGLLPIMGKSRFFIWGLAAIIGVSLADAVRDNVVCASKPEVFSPHWNALLYLLAVMGLSVLAWGWRWVSRRNVGERVDGRTENDRRKDRWMGYVLAGCALVPVLVLLYVAMSDWEIYKAKVNDPTGWWLNYGFLALLAWMPYGCVWGMRVVFRRSHWFFGMAVVFALAGAAFYAIAGPTAAHNRHGGMILFGIPLIQIHVLILVALVAGVECWLRRKPRSP